MNDDRLYLIHILERLDRIAAFTEEGRDPFFDSVKTQDAVIRNLEVIGEAARQLSDRVREHSSDIPWRQITGLRNVLIHNYMDVDLERVWNVVRDGIPLLRQQIAQILEDLDNP